MIDAPWLRACKRLPVGGVERFRCCGPDKAAVLFNHPGSWEMYCHRCKSAPKERKQFVQVVVQQDTRPVQPAPADVMSIADVRPEVQSQVYAFLVSKGLMPDMVEDVQWSDLAKRMVFPVSSGLSLGRAMMPWQNPKWIQYNGRSSFAPIHPKNQPVQGIVLTEDLLSAKKVAYASNHFGSGNILCVALLGTRLDSKLKVWIAEHGWPVLLMLDGDEAGYSGVKRIRRELRPFVQVQDFAVDGKDPKDLTIAVILEALNWMH